jgi:predicted MFS family arabinose efflux permease
MKHQLQYLSSEKQNIDYLQIRMSLKRIFNFYIDSFRGFSREVWWLSLVTLINRSGTMVIPFLSLYLTEDLDFGLAEVGWIMSAFGLGSVCGSYLGGVLNDRIGSYKTMNISLFSSGILFILTQYVHTFWSIALMVFFVILCADIFRPALFVALKAYSKEENQTRSVTLIRLAINLGFSVGPAVAGFLIYNWGYGSLFWVDGLTCFFALAVLLYFLNPKRANVQQETVLGTDGSPYKDGKYLLFCFGMLIFGFAFLQYFSTVPLYYRNEYHLSEEYIGLILGFNGFLVFLVEMPLIYLVEKKSSQSLLFIVYGFLLLSLSFIVYNLWVHEAFLWIGMILMSFAEMLVFPFSNNFAMNRSKRGSMGKYMALYSIAFSISHILGHNTGLQLIEKFDFTITWWVFGILSTLGMLIFFILDRSEKKVKLQESE